MFKLKSYQKFALTALEEFLQACALGQPVEKVFEELCKHNGWGKGKYLDSFGGKPCVCLRVPTGGGKTLIAAAAVRRIDDAYCRTGAPVVLWLTPSDAITEQTYAALANSEHPYRQALDADFRSVKVAKVDEIDHVLQQSDFRQSCLIIVSTIQTFNIEDTSLRNVYAFNERFQRFFLNLSPNQVEGLEKVDKHDLENPDQTYLTIQDIGRVKYSLANLLNLFEPIIIVDEAHNNRTDKFFTTLNRLNPSVVLELTATPNKKLNNVIYQVSAWELKTENMVKLPVILGEFTNGWESCLDESVKARKLLEAKAAQEPDYIRPIVLIQAQPKDLEPTPEQVKNYLMEVCGIQESQIAIATGTTKELAGVDLFAKTCPIRFVITVKALKEGWDCSFAYVLCSLQNIQSAKDVEQLLGRVMRMPYAKARQTDELKNAYANVVSASTYTAATLLKDRLVENLGFNRIEADEIVEQVQEKGTTGTEELFPTGGSETAVARVERPSTFTLQTRIDLERTIQNLGLEGLVSITPVQTSSGKKIVQVAPKTDPELLRKFVQTASENESEKVAAENVESLSGLFSERARKSHSVDQTPFPELPQLCFNVDGQTRLLSEKTVMSQTWDPALYGVEMEFNPTSTINRYQIDATEKQILEKERLPGIIQLPFDSVSIADDARMLVNWVAIRVRRADIYQPVMLRFVKQVVCDWLMKAKEMSLSKLYEHKVELARAVELLLAENYRKAVKGKFEQALLDLEQINEFPEAAFVFKFDPAQYMPRNPYNPAKGGREFKKHFCPVIHDLRAFTDSGAPAEEYMCAEAIDTNPDVKRWIRNIERSDYAFWLPLAEGRFFPDFILELSNGKILVIEYKGENLYSNDDSREKRRVGKVWEKASKGRCFFLMARKKDEAGRNVEAQIQAKIDEILGR